MLPKVGVVLHPEYCICFCSQILPFSGVKTANRNLILGPIESPQVALFVAKDLGGLGLVRGLILLVKVGVVLHPENSCFWARRNGTFLGLEL